MTVYVDELKVTPPFIDSRKWPYKYYCHMVADTVSELLNFAETILEINTKWFQHNEREWLAHFDLTKSLRDRAIRNGALEITSKEWVKRHFESRKRSAHSPATSTGDVQ